MYKRKAKMTKICDGIIALLGRFGILDELFKMLIWGQLGLHKKPIGILNFGSFYDELFYFWDKMVNKGFLKEINRRILLVSENIV